MRATTRNLTASRPVRAASEARGPAMRDYLALTRPRITLMVALTACPVLGMGQAGWPEPGTFFGLLLGIALLGSGCSAINAWVERDVDARMPRTRDRPLPSGRVTPGEALAFGLLVSAAGILALRLAAGPLAALVGAFTLAWYIAVYTLWLKPRSAHNTVAGSLAGATAPLIADAAVDGRIGPWGWVLFAIIFLWQPPHVWAIALYRKGEYAAAGIPMMPARVGDRGTRRRMLGWALALVPVTLIPWLGGALGPVYAVTALAAGGLFVGSILVAMIEEDPRADRRVFVASLFHVATVFSAMLAGVVLG